MSRHLQNYSEKYYELFLHSTQIIVQFAQSSERARIGKLNLRLERPLTIVVAKPTPAYRRSSRGSQLSSIDRHPHSGVYSRPCPRSHVLNSEWYGNQTVHSAEHALTP